MSLCGNFQFLTDEDMREYPVPSDDNEAPDTKIAKIRQQIKHIITHVSKKGKVIPAMTAWSAALTVKLEQTDYA